MGGKRVRFGAAWERVMPASLSAQSGEGASSLTYGRRPPEYQAGLRDHPFRLRARTGVLRLERCTTKATKVAPGGQSNQQRREASVEDRIGLIRTSYWVAAVADFVIAVLALIPARMGVDDFVYPMGLMSAVAFSWGVLLLFADRKPLERRWVLLPTILVVFLLGVAVLYAGFVGLIPLQQVLASSAAVVLVLTLLLYTCFRTRGT